MDAPPQSVGDYAASLGTTGHDTTIQGTPPIPPNGAIQAVAMRFADITDGLSSTFLVGEKHVPLGGELQHAPIFDCGMYDGHNPACNTRAAGPLFPFAASWHDRSWKFGSRHPGLCQFVFGDGSVHVLRAQLDPYIAGLLAQRNDGKVVPDY